MARYPKEAVCKTCATPFIHNGERLRKYCSRKCFLASVSIQRQVTKICPTCSKPFLVVVSNKSRNFTCCSVACSGAYRRRNSKVKKHTYYLKRKAQTNNQELAA
jgi:endogenous inhibitor of DNA gyrase (YacG/DUF329 family)